MTWTARTFWRLPAVAHEAIARLTGGWRIVAMFTGPEAAPIWKYRWERWPGNLRPIEYETLPW